MAVFLSPNVITTETNDTVTTVEQSNYNGAFVGTFKWGPANEPTYISQGEDELVAKFGASDDTYYKSVLVAADFLSYANTMYVVRSVGANARNAFPSSKTPQLIRNDNEFQNSFLSGTDFLGKYPGSFLNGVLVSVVDYNSFPTWEYAAACTYTPGQGEYSIAVVDTTGNITGSGAVKQVERMYVGGAANGGVQQTQTIAITGTATGGTQQSEVLTFTGTATDTSITVNGTAVTLVVGDDQNTVASKVATALAAVTGTYASATSVANLVTVTFKTPTSGQTAIASGSTAGLSWSSTVTVVGNASFVFNVAGESVTLNYNDSAATVTTKIYNVLGLDTTNYVNVTKPTATTIQYTYVAYGAQTVPTFTSNGITVTPTISTPGSSVITLSVFGTSVTVANGDSASTVASKIAGTNGFSSQFSNVWVNGPSIYYTRLTTGAATLMTAPAVQSGLQFSIYLNTQGTLGGLIEKYELLNNVVGSTFADGSVKFWYDRINQSSKYIRAGDKTVALSARSVSLVGGVDDNNVTINSGLALFNNKQDYDIEYIITGAVTVAEQQAAVDLAESRLDCMAVVAPMQSDVVNNAGNEATAVDLWKVHKLGRDSEYAFAVDNWAYVYDKYCNVYRWIPATGGTAGIFARSAQENEPWTPPAGLTRGRYKNYVKMAWNPSEGARNLLYPDAINSIVTFPGIGIVLYGDKTMTSKPSAFDRYNTRWAFIVAEKSLTKMAKYFLFELNTATTRAQFVNAARPFLRNMMNRNAFADFRIICDTTNNDASVITQNQMYVKILIKPVYSINWIVMNLTAVRPDVSFDTYVQS